MTKLRLCAVARGLPRKTRDWSGMLGTGVLEEVENRYIL
jgi:hypothetical protein